MNDRVTAPWRLRNVNASLAALVLVLMHFDAVGSEPAETAGEWQLHGLTTDEQRHSPLQTINTETVDQLGLAWHFPLGTSRGIEATPIVIDGTMYLTGSWSVVYALDAKTGKQLWRYDPEVDKAVGVKACCDVVNRGVAVSQGKVFVGVIDGRLEALDAKTGKRLWSTLTVDQSKPYTITGAPRVVRDKVLIGNGGADLGVRGYLNAYDKNTGELIWRFYTTPNPNKQPDNAASDDILKKLANDTWGDDGEWKTAGGGGTVWDSIVYDAKNDQIIFGVGNASPWNWQIRDPSGGDNLFVSSIIAVDADTGAYRWHFQTTPGDSWDYTATQSIILAELPIDDDGGARRVVMQAPKNGFFYVLDAETGEFLSADNFVTLNWADGLDENGRPIYKASARDVHIPFLQLPGPLGAHNWHPMSFNPTLGLAFIPAQEIRHTYVTDPNLPDSPVAWNTGMDFSHGLPVEPPRFMLRMLKAGARGRLIAWDPIKQAPRWTVEHPTTWNGGTLSTAGELVFQGQLGGDLVAYDAKDGTALWRYATGAGVASGPITYEIDGEQYVTVTTGWGSSFALLSGFSFDEKINKPIGSVVTFKLGANAAVPNNDWPKVDRVIAGKPFGTPELLAEGAKHYGRNCMVCHGAFAISSGVLPDLRWSGFAATEEGWRAAVIDGALRSNGMVSFAEWLSPTEAEAIRAYVLHQGSLEMAQRDSATK
ncbi:MAG: PQQ-dependent dehydrogenase, methanol/ethanol family [Pseudomonadota bacterium]